MQLVSYSRTLYNIVGSELNIFIINMLFSASKMKNKNTKKSVLCKIYWQLTLDKNIWT